jgi:hypothetical protein
MTASALSDNATGTACVSINSAEVIPARGNGSVS